MTVAKVDFSSYPESVTRALDKIGAKERLSRQTSVLIKPNLVSPSPHPVTTPAECCEAVIEYTRSCSGANIVIGEGTGDPVRETYEIFDLLGYTKLALRHGISLIDLNAESVTRQEKRECYVFPEIYLPEICFTHFIISVPVLKAHSLAGITGALKNMMGFAPPKYSSGGAGGWKKSVFHNDMHRAIVELNMYRRPDLSVMDASVGLAEFHLGGRSCSPPAGKIIAGNNAAAVDRQAATLLGLDWEMIPHLGLDMGTVQSHDT